MLRESKSCQAVAALGSPLSAIVARPIWRLDGNPVAELA